MSVRNNFFTELAGASMWDVAVAINRGNALPLDRYSVFQSLEEVNAYVNNPKGSIAYPGQILTVVGENATTVYYLDQDLAVKPVGVIPNGDDKSIEVTSEGVISLLGAATAEDGTLPMVEDGALVWKTLEDIGAGDGNDNTTYEITPLEKGEGEALETYGIQIQAKFNGVASGDPIVIPFDVYTKSEIDEVVDGLDERIQALEDAEDADTTYSVKEGDKVLKLAGTEFSTEISLKHENGMISLTGIGGEVIAEFSDADFVKDSVLEDVNYNILTNEIEFTWKTVDGNTKTDAVNVADFVQTYTAGKGLDLDSNEFTVKIDTASESFLSVGDNGLKLAGVQDAIDAAKDESAQDATDKASQALADAKADAAKLYATKEYVGTIPSNYTETNVIAFINKKAEEVLAAAQGGSSETAASVKQQLDNYKSENNTRVENIEGDITTIENKLTTIEENAQVNLIETVKVNGTALTITDKAVDIAVPTMLSQLNGYTGIDERITTAKTQADLGVAEAGKAMAKAEENAGKIETIDSKFAPINEAINNHAVTLAQLAEADTLHAAEYKALSDTVAEHTNLIGSKANSSDLAQLQNTVSGNSADITNLKTVTIPALTSEIGNKANSADVYTKTEVGVIAEGKTLVKMIEEAQAAASYDDAEIRGLIGDNAAAIAAIYVAPNGETPASGVLATEIARVEGLVNAEKTRAEGIEAGHESRIATMENFWKAADDPEGTIDKLAEIVAYIEADKTGAIDMAADIQANSNAIAAIYTPAEGDKDASGFLAVEINRAKEAEQANANAIALINDGTNGILAQAKAYTDDKILNLPFASADKAGLVKSSNAVNKIKVENDGTMTLNKISTDLLELGEAELVLNGGTAES